MREKNTRSLEATKDHLGAKWCLIQSRAKIVPEQTGYWNDVSYFVKNYHCSIANATDNLRQSKIKRVISALQSVSKHQTNPIKSEINAFFKDSFGIDLEVI